MSAAQIETIEWFADTTPRGALLTVSDGEHSCFVFCYPCSMQPKDPITTPLHAFQTENIQLTNEAESIHRIGDSLSHRVVGVLRSVSPDLVSIGGIELVLDGQTPGDIFPGDTICFVCSRLDA